LSDTKFAVIDKFVEAILRNGIDVVKLQFCLL